MNKIRNKYIDIHERIFTFVISVLKLIKQIPRTPENISIISQLIDSVTSVGANDQEADGVSSAKDFIHCYTIVRKELKETHYWLRIVRALNEKLSNNILLLLQENIELINIISKILINSRK